MVVPSFIQSEFARARTVTDRLFAQVLTEAFYDRAIPERHRLIFYAGHLDAFDWNLLGRGYKEMEPIEAEFDKLFAFGIDPAVGHLPDDKPSDWPEVPEVRRYVAKVRTNVDRLTPHLPERVLRMAVEHRLMHAETLTYLIHNLPYSRRLTRMRATHSETASPALEFIQIPAGKATLGKSRENGFGWDNEFDEHVRDVEAFGISKYKVTNGQYLDFVKDGGPAPHYWTQRGSEWRYRGYDGEVPLPKDFPVYVSYQQAEAYARWIGKKLPTEEQFHRAAFGTPTGSERQFPWSDESVQKEHGNFDCSSSDLLPVTSHPVGNSAFGVSQLVGNGWEWTSTAFAPFEGFSAEPLYRGYSADFFDGQHRVVKGASCVTDRMLIRRSFRNWFRDSYPYAYTTFRLVEN
jgi:formylglycine-generating enzyme required for sulfatase activity